MQALRYYRPELPIVGVVPPPYDATYHGRVSRPHRHALAAAWRWGEREQVPLVDLDAIVAPELAAGRMNPDGMHWTWEIHAVVGRSLATALRNHEQSASRRMGSGG